ncbi:MAG: HAMP domain-containing histidine kinase, partial [Candidatus Sungbacteria bacterium]|nr:HAMP domain-containing histidine kinase [Candidatus Sungbacteria bacterium]
LVKKYNLTSLLNLLTYDLQTLARSRNVELKFISKPEAVEALIDQQKLGYAFSLIIDNAIRYSPNGKVTVNIDGTADDVAVVTVEDTGIGIAEAFRGRLFYKFSRAKDAARLEPSGLGISLYIVKHIINKHDGQISVETQEGKGTKVTIVLPKP